MHSLSFIHCLKVGDDEWETRDKSVTCTLELHQALFLPMQMILGHRQQYHSQTTVCKGEPENDFESTTQVDHMVLIGIDTN